MSGKWCVDFAVKCFTASREAKLTPEAQEFISKKIKKLMDEGKPQDQAIAIAYNMARERGFDVPESPTKSSYEAQHDFRKGDRVVLLESLEGVDNYLGDGVEIQEGAKGTIYKWNKKDDSYAVEFDNGTNAYAPAHYFKKASYQALTGNVTWTKLSDQSQKIILL